MPRSAFPHLPLLPSSESAGAPILRCLRCGASCPARPLAPGLIVDDHRLLGWETLRGPAAYIEVLKQLVDLAPDVQLRVDHLTMADPRFLYVATWVGTHEGANFETPSLIVCELDETGKIRRFDQYDMDRLDEARRSVEGRAAVSQEGLRENEKRPLL